MAVDTNLIKGAYAANAPMVTKSGSAEGLIGLGDKINKGEAERAKEEEEKTIDIEADLAKKTSKASETFDKTLSKVVNEGDLSEVLSSKIYSHHSANAAAFSEAHVSNDKNKQREIISSINRTEAGLEVIDRLQTDITGLNPNKKVSNVWTHTALGENVLSAFEDKDKSVSFAKDGEAIIKVGDKELSPNELESLLNKLAYVDTGFKEFIGKKLESMVNEQGNFGEVRENTLNSLEALVRSNVNEANLNSLVYDRVIGTTSMYQDILAAFKNKTYSDLGVTDEMLKDAKIKPTDKLDELDIVNIVDQLTTTDDGVEAIVEYYTNALRKQFKPKVKPSDNTFTGPLTEGEASKENSIPFFTP